MKHSFLLYTPRHYHPTMSSSSSIYNLLRSVVKFNNNTSNETHSLLPVHTNCPITRLVAEYAEQTLDEWVAKGDPTEQREEAKIKIIECEEKKLTELDLSNHKLSSLPYHLFNMTWLEELALANNQLTSIPAEVSNLANLQYLWLSHNQFTSIPAEVSNLTKLKELELSNNQLTSIPAEIGNLTNLQYLWLNNNRLTSIPTEFSNLTNLQWLWLSDNRLTSIPTSLFNLTNLTILDLTYNPRLIITPEVKQLIKNRNL